MNPGAIRTHNLSRRAATDLWLRPSGTVTGYCTGTVTGYCTGTDTGYCTGTVTGYFTGTVTGYCTEQLLVTVPAQLLVTVPAQILVTVPAQLLVILPAQLLVTAPHSYWLLYRHSYWLLYHNITKPVKALQQFLTECRQSNSLCIIISKFAGYHLQTISEINNIRWLYSLAGTWVVAGLSCT